MSVVAALGIVVLVPASVWGGTYEVGACDFASGSNNAWTAANDSPATLEQAEVCPSGGAQFNGLRTFDKLGSSNTPADAEAAFHLDAPPGTTITGAILRRWIGKDTSNFWVPFVRADGDVLDTCTIPGGEFNCQVGTPGGSDRTYGGLTAGRLSVGVRCAQVPPSTCSTGGTIHHVWAVLYGATVTIDDPTPPVLGVESAGSSLFAGWVNGTRQLSLTANDAESGVRELQVQVGGQVRHAFAVAETSGGCGTSNTGVAYTFPQPCAGARGMNGTRALEIDTASWPSGLHTSVTVRALDAGGEMAEAGPFTVGVDHDPPTNVQLEGLPRTGRVRPERRITRISATADDAHSGVARVEVEWRRLGSPWRPYVPGSEPIARRGQRYQFRARAIDQLGNRSGDIRSRFLRATRAPAVVVGARLARGALVLVARAPRRVLLALSLRAPGRGRGVRTHVRVRGRTVKRIPLPEAMRDTAAARLRISYRRRGRTRIARTTVRSRPARVRLPL